MQGILPDRSSPEKQKPCGRKRAVFDVPFEMEEILFDPQTSGGLLVSIEKVMRSSVWKS